MLLNTRYKTGICKNQLEQKCKMGDRCHFAHSESQLRTMSDPLPEGTTHITDPNFSIMASLGIASIASSQLVKDVLLERGFIHPDYKKKNIINSQKEVLKTENANQEENEANTNLPNQDQQPAHPQNSNKMEEEAIPQKETDPSKPERRRIIRKSRLDEDDIELEQDQPQQTRQEISRQETQQAKQFVPEQIKAPEPETELPEGQSKRAKCLEHLNQTCKQLQIEQALCLVLQDKMVQQQVQTVQLNYMLHNLELIHCNNAYVLARLNLATEVMLSEGNPFQIADIIAEILLKEDFDPEIIQKHAILMNEAKEIANIINSKLTTYLMETQGRGYSFEKKL